MKYLHFFLLPILRFGKITELVIGRISLIKELPLTINAL
jgi:hypothetical protein